MSPMGVTVPKISRKETPPKKEQIQFNTVKKVTTNYLSSKFSFPECVALMDVSL